DFSEYNGSPAGRIIRINDDGTRDETYSMGSGFDQEVNSMAWLPDGKLLVGGKFTTYNGVPARYLVRLNQDGTLDQPLEIADLLEVALVKVQPDSKILVNSAGSLFRLQPDGSVDPSFTRFGDFGTRFSRLHDMEVVEGGKILISGEIHSSSTPYSIIRLNKNGTLDETFKMTRGGRGYDLGVDGEGRIYTYGFYSAVAGEDDTFYTDLKRLFPDGTVDPSFDLNPPPPPYRRPTYYEGQTLVLQEDGKLLIDPNE